jgi:hypothetical protein
MVIAPIRCKPGFRGGGCNSLQTHRHQYFQGAGAFRGLRPAPDKFQLTPPPRQGAVTVFARVDGALSHPG